jgi:uncharacterized protein (DUF952 family)
MMGELIYHICRANEWVVAEENGSYGGSSQDQEDGFIHFSSQLQVVESASKHRAGQDGLVLLEVDGDKLGSALKWELSRNGTKFPHLYSNLPVSAVIRISRLHLDPDKRHIFPANWGIK